MDKKENKPCIGTPKALFGEGSEPEGGEEFPLFEFFFLNLKRFFFLFVSKFRRAGPGWSVFFEWGCSYREKLALEKNTTKKKSDCGSNAYVREQFSGHVAERKLGEEDWWRRGGGEQMDRNGSWPTLCIFIFSYFYKSFESSSWWPWHQRAIDCQSKRQDSEPNGWKKTKLCFVSFVLKSCCAFLLLPQTVFFYLQQRGTAEQKNLRKWREKEIFFFLRMNEERDGGWRRTRWNYHSE